MLSLVLVLLLVSPVWAGEIHGEITLSIGKGGLKRAENKLENRRRILKKYKKLDAAAYSSESKWNEGGIPKSEQNDEDERRHFVVYLAADGDGAKLKRTPKSQNVLQQGRRFRDHVTPVVLGSSIVFKNADAFHHYIECRADDTLTVEEQKQNEDEERTPTKAGPLELFCNIHHKMNAFVFVAPNDFFCMPKNGRFSLEKVPPGTYQLTAWHPRIGTKTQKVVVPQEGAVEVNFTL